MKDFDKHIKQAAREYTWAWEKVTKMELECRTISSVLVKRVERKFWELKNIIRERQKYCDAKNSIEDNLHI